MLALKDIPRIKAGTSFHAGARELQELDQERLYLATRARDLLGYSALVADVTGERTVGVKEGKLTEGLRTLEIQVLDTATVIEYQLEEIVRLTRVRAHEDVSSWATGWFRVAEWQRAELKSYDRPIPEFVLDKAIRIKEQVPDAQFWIQHLSDAKADPFLVVKRDREVYYIEAWDEPRFEGRLSR